MRQIAFCYFGGKTDCRVRLLEARRKYVHVDSETTSMWSNGPQ